MTPRDMALAALTSVIWGLAFVASKLALDGFSAPQLTFLRFAIAALPVLFLPRPAVSWPMLILIGLTLFTGQFLLLFFAFERGMPVGVASVTQQMQAFFTVGLAAVFLGDRPTPMQATGMALALVGLAVIALTIGGNLTTTGLALNLGAAFSWATGNVLLKRLGPRPMLDLMVWLSLVPLLPSLLVAQLTAGDLSIVKAAMDASWTALAATLYLGAVATVLAYAIWSRLLARYPSAMVAPFALLAPCVGVIASHIVFGEEFTTLRSAGMGLIVAGVAIAVMPQRSRPRAST
jgi:O-acetylserine/cysteine efflux transporter